jgi:hypothetical protein
LHARDETNRIYLEHGQPIRFGADSEKAVRQRKDGSVEVVPANGEVLIHDAHAPEPSLAFALSRLTWSTGGGRADRRVPRRRAARLRRVHDGTANEGARD